MKRKIIGGLKRKPFLSDGEWLQAAIDKNPEQELYIPSGVYKIEKPLVVKNGASLRLDKAAVLLAVKEMDFVVVYDGAQRIFQTASEIAGHKVADYNRFFVGGTIDGAGLASCMTVENYFHYTVRETTFLNGKKYGLRVSKGGYELFAFNCYFNCTIQGLAGNSAVYSEGGDSHFTDIVVVDYTVGFDMQGNMGANRLTRCHVWGGPLGFKKDGDVPEMLVDSVGFRLVSRDNFLRDCYADTCQIGYDLYEWTRMIGCAYTNNTLFRLDDTVIIRHNTDDPLIVDHCFFSKALPENGVELRSEVFAGSKKNVRWGENMLVRGYEKPDFNE